jgi:hypothetical protein
MEMGSVKEVLKLLADINLIRFGKPEFVTHKTPTKKVNINIYV